MQEEFRIVKGVVAVFVAWAGDWRSFMGIFVKTGGIRVIGGRRGWGGDAICAT